MLTTTGEAWVMFCKFEGMLGKESMLIPQLHRKNAKAIVYLKTPKMNAREEA